MNKTDKIYVAGHRGLVGSALIRSLKKQGYTNLLLRTHDELDLTIEPDVAEFFRKEKPDYVFLAAAKVGGIHANNTYPAEFIHNNLAIQTNVIHQAYKNDVKRLLFLGSSCIYPKNAPQPLKEEYLLTGQLEETNRPYAIAKIAGIEMCWSYNRQYGTQFLSVMPTNLYGPGDYYDLNNSHVLPALIRKFHLAKLASEGHKNAILNDEERHGDLPEPYRTELLESCEKNEMLDVSIWGTGKPKREFMYSEDMADTCVRLMNLTDKAYMPLLGSSRNDGQAPVVNIGIGSDITINELAQQIKDVVGFKGRFIFDINKSDGTSQKLMDTSFLNSLFETNFLDLSDGIKRTYEAYLTQSLSLENMETSV